MKNKVIALFLIIFSVSGILCAESGDSLYVAEHYTKYEYRIPMRDGVRLFTAVYVPKDTSQDYPFLLNRTPYSVGPYGENSFPEHLGPSKEFTEEGYIFVYQDVRGRFMSEGEYEDIRPNRESPDSLDESRDTYETIDWLLKNVRHNNGRAGIWGISYPGFYAAMAAIDGHPALKAVSPQAPVADWFIDDDFHRHGTLWLSHMFGFLGVFGKPRPELTTKWTFPDYKIETPDGYKFFLDMGSLSNINKYYYKNDIRFWNDIVKHPDYDRFWQERSLLPHLINLKPAILTVGGWFDAEDLYGALNVYKSAEKNNPGIENSLVMGPWYHGGWERSDGDHLGSVQFKEKTGPYFLKEIELPFFNFYLKSKGTFTPNEATVFETGSNTWKTYEQWPPKSAVETSLYIQSGKGLSFNPPQNKGTSYDEYISDPNAPVPFTSKISTNMPREYMVEDQRFAERRSDVLAYTGEILKEDITLSGPITAELYVSTSGTDADYVVKLIDVFPDDAPDNESEPCSVKMGGYEMMVRGEIMRARYRNSFEKPEAMVPNKVTKVSFTLQDINHSFKKGHKIMVQIQSSWFPLSDRNPQKFVNIYEAKDSDFQKANERIYHSAKYPSRLIVGKLAKDISNR
ncbi:MAG: CocE/NonD family hydrolase [Bacteroidota bacterium]|jgi:putative CocE/NonD family hydrolase|nr:CocE/NonD family hydrolase [Ignavibacteria bacterium]MCU7499232.1 CocE/NonD family hydrolase [Ignavibacteria bacterium]MCU7512302.1 CocE/NonD family hydrolase [Ignavibacteria bacterium]MCU7520330.1 CocE/NonD family hydrolase [Ignavibacteria bacterium]MCU7523933.1 CocE/NonD family hydrolase [Ignavibacteria bacterium]